MSEPFLSFGEALVCGIVATAATFAMCVWYVRSERALDHQDDMAKLTEALRAAKGADDGTESTPIR